MENIILNLKKYADVKNIVAQKIELKSPISILIGCNGLGKTTTLIALKNYCKQNYIPVLYFDLRQDDKTNIFNRFINFGEGDANDIGTIFSSSEGQIMIFMLNHNSKNLMNFIAKGKTKEEERSEGLLKAFERTKNILDGDEIIDEPEKIIKNQRYLLFDAFDSGLSIDNIICIKQYLNQLIEIANENNIDLKIIISANSFELSRNMDCINPTTGTHLKFNDYEEYKKYILKTRESVINRENKKKGFKK